MSSKKTTDESGESGDTLGDAGISSDSDESQGAASGPAATEIPAVKPERRKSGGLVSWLALLLAIAALAAFAVSYLKDRSAAGATNDNDASVATLSTSVRANREALAALEQSIAALSGADTSGGAEIDALERQLNARLRQLEVLPRRLSNIESTVSSLQGISTGAREAWLLAEAEYYMQIANAQLQLAGNPELAALALQLADERILQLADAGLTNVRRALSDELRALEVMDSPDTEGVTLTLASLASVVNSLPLRQEVAVQTSESDDLDPDLTGVDRAYASLKSALGGVVSVRRIDESMQPLIAPEAQYFLRTNLALQLQAARLAVLRSEEAIFAQSLDDASAWLNEYYDTSNTAVQSAQQTIAGIRNSVFSVAIPDISQSLRLLRQFNAFADATERPVSEATDAEPVQEEEEELQQ